MPFDWNGTPSEQEERSCRLPKGRQGNEPTHPKDHARESRNPLVLAEW